jgi:hypothetical protein
MNWHWPMALAPIHRAGRHGPDDLQRRDQLPRKNCAQPLGDVASAGTTSKSPSLVPYYLDAPQRHDDGRRMPAVRRSGRSRRSSRSMARPFFHPLVGT